MASLTPIRRREAISFYLSIAPWLIGFLLFTAGPMLLSAYASLTHWDLITDPRPAGLDNFAALAQDPLFWQSLKVTVLNTLAYVPLDVVGGLGLAMLVRPRLRGMRAFRTIFYLPSVVAGVAFVVVWVWLLNPRGGLVNLVLSQLGIEGPNWLNDPHWALVALVLMSFWGWGRSMVIYLGGLQTIPSELYEAAAMDGAGRWKAFWKVTLPLLSPTLFFNLVLSIISTFQTFTSAFVATNGGPLDSTLFIVLYIYRQAFEFFHMGYAAALAWVLFAIILALTVIIFRTQTFWVTYLGERSHE
jgi:multiple sugar transport system permease protein